MGHCARRYLARHGLPTAGLRIEADWDLSVDPHRVGAVRIAITVPVEVPVERLPALVAVASHCTVHNTLTSAPDISVTAAPANTLEETPA